MPDEEKTDPAGVPAIRANLKDKTITLPFGTIMIIGSALLGAGGTAGFQNLFSVDSDILDRISALEERLEDAEEVAKETKDVVDETFEIVNSAHKSRGRVGVPSPAPVPE